jgi:hypothetical protein
VGVERDITAALNNIAARLEEGVGVKQNYD